MIQKKSFIQGKSLIEKERQYFMILYDIFGFSWNLSVGQEIQSHNWIPSKTYGCRLSSGLHFASHLTESRIFAPLKIQWISSCGEFEVRWDVGRCWCISRWAHYSTDSPKGCCSGARKHQFKISVQCMKLWNYEGTSRDELGNDKPMEGIYSWHIENTCLLLLFVWII